MICSRVERQELTSLNTQLGGSDFLLLRSSTFRIFSLLLFLFLKFKSAACFFSQVGWDSTKVVWLAGWLDFIP